MFNFDMFLDYAIVENGKLVLCSDGVMPDEVEQGVMDLIDEHSSLKYVDLRVNLSKDGELVMDQEGKVPESIVRLYSGQLSETEEGEN